MIPSSYSSWEERELVDVCGCFRDYILEVVLVSPNESSWGNGRWEWNADQMVVNLVEESALCKETSCVKTLTHDVPVTLFNNLF